MSLSYGSDILVRTVICSPKSAYLMLLLYFQMNTGSLLDHFAGLPDTPMKSKFSSGVILMAVFVVLEKGH